MACKFTEAVRESLRSRKGQERANGHLASQKMEVHKQGTAKQKPFPKKRRSGGIAKREAFRRATWYGDLPGKNLRKTRSEEISQRSEEESVGVACICYILIREKLGEAGENLQLVKKKR